MTSSSSKTSSPSERPTRAPPGCDHRDTGRRESPPRATSSAGRPRRGRPPGTEGTGRRGRRRRSWFRSSGISGRRRTLLRFRLGGRRSPSARSIRPDTRAGSGECPGPPAEEGTRRSRPRRSVATGRKPVGRPAGSPPARWGVSRRTRTSWRGRAVRRALVDSIPQQLPHPPRPPAAGMRRIGLPGCGPRACRRSQRGSVCSDGPSPQPDPHSPRPARATRPYRSRPGAGCLRAGAKSYAKDFGCPVEPVRGQRYSPVRLMCSQPRGETWARNSAGIASPAFRLAKTASPSFIVFQ